MTLPRFFALTDYWIEHPPAHLALQTVLAVLGVKKETKRQDGEEQGSAPDLTHMTAGTATSLNPFGDAMEVRKPRVIYIDNREKKIG